MQKFICYLRVSTAEQGRSGLGLEAQESDCRRYVEQQGGTLLDCLTEVETGKNDDRPTLKQAFHMADMTGATVVFAKLDRLSRNAAFLHSLKDSGVKFVALDCPRMETLDLGMRAVFAQHERELISARTKAALARLKAQGKQLGNPNGFAAGVAEQGRAKGRESASANAAAFAAKVSSILTELHANGLTTLQAKADALNAKGILTPRNGKWTATSVSRVLSRLP